MRHIFTMARAWCAYIITVKLIPAPWIHWRLFMWLLPYAGDWAHRQPTIRAERT